MNNFTEFGCGNAKLFFVEPLIIDNCSRGDYNYYVSSIGGELVSTGVIEAQVAYRGSICS